MNIRYIYIYILDRETYVAAALSQVIIEGSNDYIYIYIYIRVLGKSL